MTKQPRRTYEFGPFRLIPEERLLLRDGQPVALTAKCFDLLVALVENSGSLVGKDELMQRVWPDAFVEEANLSVNVSTLRRALGEGPNDDQYIQTVPRHGYRFVAHVTRAAEPEGAEEGPATLAAGESAADPAPRRTGWQRGARRWIVPLAGASAIALIVLGLNRGVRTQESGAPGRPRIQSLAVLPLQNRSGDRGQDYFTDGLTEGLITDLAQTGALRVLSRPTVMPFKESRKPPRQIGHELRVDGVLTGSVERSGERLRIAAELVDARTGERIWADRYERELRDVLALQRTITEDIANGVRIRLSPRARVNYGTVGPVDPQAYDDYLRGQYFLYRQNREDNEAAIAALKRATAADPSFAAAHAELAQAYVWKLFLFAPKEREWEEKAFVEAEKALALDPNSAIAHLARGRLLWTPANHFPHLSAIREYRQALNLNPNLDEARNQLALVYCHIGAFEEALSESQKAIETNPNNTLAQFRTAQTLNFQGKHREALTMLRAIPPKTNPSLLGHQIAWALFNLGRKAEASSTLAQLLKEHPEDSGGLYTSLQALLAASAGKRGEAEEKIRAAMAIGKGFGHFHHTAYHIACAYAVMHEPARAVQWLETAADDGFPCYPLFERDPNLQNLRGEAGFRALQANLRQQWQGFRRALE